MPKRTSCIAAFAVALVACTPDARPAPSVALDNHGRRACAEFARVADDVQTRALVGPDRNAALQRVFDYARRSDVPRLSPAAQLVLTAAIQDDQAALRESLVVLRGVCGLTL